jgi:uncharacterized protein (TIGR02117 family)
MMAVFKSYLKRTFKIIGVSILVLLMLIGTWFLCAWVLPKIKVNSDKSRPENGIEIYVKSNGVHTDIVLPAKNLVVDWKNLFRTETFEDVAEDAEYLSFGWGDKGFYLDTPTWDDLKFSTAFKAAFWLGESAMHLTYCKNAPPISERCKKIILNEEEYLKLSEYIKSSFQLKDNAIVLIQHPGYGSDDNFYEGKGTYNFMKTCNEWTGDALDYCGVEIGLWTPTQGGIIDELE